MMKTFFLKTIPNFTRALLIIIVCIIGFIFEFLVELPFLLILELNERFGRKTQERPHGRVK